ncbi:uncharacterized protein B0I36DRAFT_42113 [Microdochium trichocladiopsis]|uniref:Uncharacterized protein n=1 Tax=Microdochium trichocladiopsis TaxID=1682393 RepID=A0A9P9BGI8_9PEZI|nr:uncharacterized protein B0I36DRAFT_42113 [Microdochium trichocladiopsis]KAH7016072.1 hypothetical protein B0I36DRAFT_42113 [Microdochium trichocladiopsis]
MASMASMAFSLEAAKEGLDKDGFFDLEDSTTGDDVWEMERRRFPYVSEYGLDFVGNVSSTIWTTVEAILGQCTLAHWLRYKAYPGHVVCFRSGGPKAGRRALLVHLWAKGSRVEYYGGSHLHDLPKQKGARLLWETQPSALGEVGCVATPKSF